MNQHILTDEQFILKAAEAVEIVRSGGSYGEAAKETGLTKWTVKKHCLISGIHSALAGNPNLVKAAKIANHSWNNPEKRKKRIENIKKSYETSGLRESRKQEALDQWEAKRDQALVGAVVTKDGEPDYNPPNDLKTVRKNLYLRAESKCEECGLSDEQSLSEKGRRLNLHHLSYEKIIPDLEDTQLLCHSCHSKKHGRNSTLEERRSTVFKKIGQLLESLGIGKDDPNFDETPRRFGDYLLEHFVTQDQFDASLEDFSSAAFPSDYKGMIVQTGIEAYGMCPHHLLPIVYNIHVGYIPSTQTIGLSKLARLAQTCGKLPILQESLSGLITKSMVRILNTQDVITLVCGEHMCMTCRGIKARGAETTTCAVDGVFKEQGNPARMEFFEHVKSARSNKSIF